MTQEPASILVAGATNTDLVATMRRAPRAGETITATGFAIYAGGKGANQAVAARRAGAEVALLSAVGEDEFGAQRVRDLQGEGITLDAFSTRPDVSSGVAVIYVEEHGENRIAYVPGAILTVGTEEAAAAVHAVRPALVLAPNELPRDALIELFSTAREIGATTVFNTSPDPDSDPNLLSLVDVLIANEGEAETIIRGRGVAASPSSVLEHLSEVALGRRGPGCVVITLGEAGVVGTGPQGDFEVPAHRVEVVDTVGAGDTFNGALSARLVSGASLEEAVRWAVTASAMSVMQLGAQPSIPTAAEVFAFQREP